MLETQAKNLFEAFMDSIRTWLTGAGLDPLIQSKLLNSIVAVLALLLLHVMVRRITVKRFQEPTSRYHAHKMTLYTFVALGCIILGRIWLEAIHSLYTFLGLLSAGLAIALKDPVLNIFGWVFILWRKPFSLGDRIQIGTFAGDVVDQSLFQFSLLEIGNWVHADQSTGRVINVPNGKVFTEEVANYTDGLAFIWTKIPVLITFESHWQKAKRLLHDIAQQHTVDVADTPGPSDTKPRLRFAIVPGKQTPIVYTSVEASGVLLTVRVPTNARHRRATEEAIWEAILIAFGPVTDIHLAYPTQRFYQPQTLPTLPKSLDPIAKGA